MTDETKRTALLRHAFSNPYNLILLAGSIGLSFALESWGPLACGLVAEAAWLLLAPSTPAFRRFASTEASRQHRARQTAEASRSLDQVYTARIHAVGALCDDILKMATDRNLDRAVFYRGGDALAALARRFYEMAALHQRLSRFLTGSRSAEMEEEVVRLGHSMAAEKDPGVRLSLRQALTVGQRRMKQHEQIESTRRALEAKMKTLEMALDYVRSRVFAGAAEAELAGQLDELAAAASIVTSLDVEASAALAPALSPLSQRQGGAPA